MKNCERLHKLIRIVLSICFIQVLFCGCGKDVNSDEAMIDSMLGEIPFNELFGTKAEELDYPIPENRPRCLVDQIGYEANEDKCAYFLDCEIGHNFAVIDSVTDDVVYTGTIEASSKEGEELVGKGKFDDFCTKGTYYVKTDKIGRSYDFVIGTGIYEPTITELCNYFHTIHIEDSVDSEGNIIYGGWSTDIEDSAFAILNLLMAYELDSEAFTDNQIAEYSGNGIPDILDEISYEIGYLIQHAPMLPSREADICGASFAAFSWIYRNFDEDIATLALFEAEKLYAISETNSQDEVWYLFNAELFRTTGKNEYMKCLGNILTQEYINSLNDSDATFFANYAYLTTKKYADAQICYTIMENFMDSSSDYSYLSKKGTYGIDDNASGNPLELLRRMRIMTFSNSIITNKEYRTVIGNNVHYIMGANPEGKNLLPDTIDSYSMLIVILSSIDNRYVIPEE